MVGVQETSINIISEGSKLEGEIVLENVSRVHGTVIGKIMAPEGSKLVLTETAVVEGDIDADTLIIDGFVRGDLKVKSKVVVSRTGRVIGNIESPRVILEFGAHFDGKCSMEKLAETPMVSSPAPSPA